MEHAHHHSEAVSAAVPEPEPTSGVHTGHDHHGLTGHKTAFHFDAQVQLLFETLNLRDSNQLITACIILSLLAFFNEAIKLGREKLQIKMKPKQFLNITCTQKLCNGWHFLQTFLHLFQMVISYALMLAFMTFQGWICISILIGSTFGYFMFGWAHTSFNSHCG